MRSIVCLIGNNGVRFSDETLIEWANTNLPKSAFLFSSREPLYWELEMQAFESNTLSVAVRDYLASPEAFVHHRKAKRRIDAVNFSKLDREPLLAQLAYYKINELAPFLADPLTVEEESSSPDFKEFGASSFVELIDVDEENLEPDHLQMLEIDRGVNFRYSFVDLTIKNGFATADYEDPFVGELIPFAIPNDHLVAEFDTIKPFFVSRLKRKTIEVSARLRRDGYGDCRLEEVRSPQIDLINDQMIEIFRTKTLRDLMGGKGLRSVDKSLFTPEDMFDSLEDSELGKATLPNDGRELLEAILSAQKVRNAKQLQFLAGRVQQAEKKLRFVISPKFGFVFFVAGESAHHFVLELLNDHATYVWSIPTGWGTLEEEYRAIEQELSVISAIGRNQYRRLLSFEHHFWLVVHEQVEAGVSDGFPRWKNRLLEGLG